MIRQIGRHTIFMCCVSSGRPQNVHKMQELFGPLTWFVPPLEGTMYGEHDAERVRPGHGGNCAIARNRALDAASEHRGVPCVMLDDDATGKIEGVIPGNPPSKFPMSAHEALLDALNRSADYGLPLTALTHLTNAQFVSNSASTTATINGGCLIVWPNPLRFDEELPLQSDVDYGLQHVKMYGGALRLNDIFIHFRRGNLKDPSGVGVYRSEALRRYTTGRLALKWPEWVTPSEDRLHPIVKVPRKIARVNLD